MRYDAIILAGGQGSRLGGVDKAALELAGRPLVERPLAAAYDAERIVLVGPPSLRRDNVLLAREDPPGGGPAAATAAGMTTLGDGLAPWVLLLSCDLPRAEDGVPRLLAAAAPVGDADGYCLTNSDGSLQWLFALYRSEALREAIHSIGDPVGSSMRRLLQPLRLVAVPDTDDVSADLDTWEDHESWTKRLEQNGE
ncbi:molybdenum cofactor guanylyltransferase [Cumulibacter soli]|uniref:molybdenum cofactor guanylyltransferase n=1 Tax=Cumulibacter soli TaxID=2546344 RepID=UPI00106725AF|nr:NTP transferase domain-containing protein [Cumulibacter soli]